MHYFNYKETDLKNNETIKIHGRTIYAGGLYLSWSNSGVEFKFKGTRAEFYFNEYWDSQGAYVKLFADKSETKHALFGKASKIIFESENDTTHTLKLLRISAGDVYLVLNKIRIYGKQPEFLTPDAEKELKIEFIGDSITCGYGVMAPKDQTVYVTSEEDSTMTYAYMTSEILNADLRTVSISGQGVCNNAGGEKGTVFSEIFDMKLRHHTGYDHSTWTPDVVVLNCGTNDVPGGTTLDEMYKESGLLVDKVRKAYKDAKIIWTFGMMNDKFHETFNQMVKDKNEEGDKNVYYLPLDKISAEKNEIGGNGHPNTNASVKVSKKLSEFIMKILY